MDSYRVVGHESGLVLYHKSSLKYIRFESWTTNPAYLKDSTSFNESSRIFSAIVLVETNPGSQILNPYESGFATPILKASVCGFVKEIF